MPPALLPLSVVYLLQAYNSASQSMSQSLSLVVQPLSAVQPIATS